MNSTLVCWRKVNPVLHNKAFSLGSPARSPPCLIKYHTHTYTHTDHQQELLSPEEHVDLTTVSGVINHLFCWHDLLTLWTAAGSQRMTVKSEPRVQRAGGAKVTLGKLNGNKLRQRAATADALSFSSSGSLLQRVNRCVWSQLLSFILSPHSPTGETDHLPHQERKWLKRRPGSIVPSEERHSCAAQGQFFQERFGCARVCVWSN